MSNRIDLLLGFQQRAGPGVGKVGGVGSGEPKQRGERIEGAPRFGEALEKARIAGELKLSAHALSRIRRRDISLDSAAMGRLARGFDLLADRGGRDGLVMIDQNAFLVNVPNRTVVTAVGLDAQGGSNGERARVFTQIDSAVFV